MKITCLKVTSLKSEGYLRLQRRVMARERGQTAADMKGNSSLEKGQDQGLCLQQMGISLRVCSLKTAEKVRNPKPFPARETLC